MAGVRIWAARSSRLKKFVFLNLFQDNKPTLRGILKQAQDDGMFMDLKNTER